MKHKTLFLRAFSVLIAILMCGVLSVHAEKKPWVKIENGTMTFLYGEKATLARNEYSLNEGSDTPAWSDQAQDIKNVVIDESFKAARPTTCYGWFKYFSNITAIEGMENLNTSEVTNMSNMFSGCSNLAGLDLSHFDTRKVTDMSFMFPLCYGFGGLDLSSFDTQNVTNMEMMFFGSDIQHIFVSDKFTTAKVADSENMFYCCNLLSGAIHYQYDFDDHKYANTTNGYFTDVKLKDKSKYYWTKYADGTVTFCYGNKNSLGENESFLKTMDGGWAPHQDEVETAVFDESFSEARPASCYQWFTRYENLKEIKGMENLNTSEMVYMNYMFYGCKNLRSIDLSHFDTSKAKNMSTMFCSCNLLQSLDLSHFDTSNVEYMGSMFDACYSLQNLDLSNFDTSNVKEMGAMFEACYSLPYLDLSNFNTSKVEDTERMFGYCTSMRYIFVGDKFKMDRVTESENMFEYCISLAGGIDFQDDKADVAYANTENGYFTDIKNRGQAKYIWAKHTDDTFTLYFGKKDKLGENEEYMTANYRETYPYTSGITKVVFDESFKEARPASCCGYFAGFSNLTDIEGLEFLNTSKARDLNYMFYGCEKLASLDLSGFNTSAVTIMEYMFYNCHNLNKVYLSDKFTTAKVESNENMFYNSNPTIYCRPGEYAAVKANSILDGRSIWAYVDINPAAEYGTLCVQQGSDLTADSFTGFDKIYSVTKCETENDRYALLKEEPKLEPGKAYIYHRDTSAGDDAKAEIAYEPNAATAAEPATDGLLRGTFVPTAAPANSYVLNDDALLHLAATDGTTVVGANQAYLQAAAGTVLPGTLSLKTDGESGVNGIPGESEAAGNGRVYDLTGRRVNSPVKGGIYIMNGKKIVK